MDWERIGEFKLERLFITNLPMSELRKLFKDVIIVHAENLFHEDKIKYVGLSKHFQVRVRGAMVPEYQLEIFVHDNQKGRFSKIKGINWRRIQ